ncbi:LuxR C-terminal-related transcriptional regulator [Legionella feeleii]|uniref:Transcription regulator protein, response regulator containing CheY-like receiver domain and HTH DNA-binding domain n=1 Tax=Legionella feeleii TaxID=453 RepID=A0A378IUS0_9GAMM|nr:LuxR C-terminal-related transcriptional regulator [Legionella feeleii]STX38793.1 transcription regulator protein, response regulator containing CheY-like receiver domain and HTH DNA-binding domain [Legionella feeleii]
MLTEKKLQKMLLQCNTIKEVTSTLFETAPVDYFSYLEIFNNGRFTLLSSDAKYFSEKIVDGAISSYLKRTIHAEQPMQKFNIMDLIKKEGKSDHYHYFRSIEKGSGDSVFKIYTLGSTTLNNNCNPFYLNNLDSINKFNAIFSKQFEKHSKIISTEIPPEVILKEDNFKLNSDFEKNLIANKFLISKLSKREVEIITLIAKNLTLYEISNYLSLSIRTVENHIANVRKKLSVSSIEKIIYQIFGIRKMYI